MLSSRQIGVVSPRAQLGVIHEVVVLERLLDHQEPEGVELLQVLPIRQRVRRVGIHGQQDVGMHDAAPPGRPPRPIPA